MSEYTRMLSEAASLADRFTQRELYEACAGMPARSQATKRALAAWLLQYAPDRVKTLKESHSGR